MDELGHVEELAYVEKLKEAISKIKFIELITATASPVQMRLIFRVHDDGLWLNYVTHILKEEERSKLWKVHICRNYVLRNDGSGTVAYVWNLILRSDDMDKSISDLCRLLDILKEHTAVSTSLVSKYQMRGDPKKTIKPLRKKSLGGEVVNGKVVSFPLDAPMDRNTPKAPLFSENPSQKGAHYIGQG
jgi:hypothetical protein